MGRFLVTGGAGFIGSHLVARLLAEDNEVVVLDDLSSGQRTNLDAVLSDRPSRSSDARDNPPGVGDGGPAGEPIDRGRFTFIHGSILDADALGSALEGAHAVFHQAAIPSVPRSFADPSATLRANVEGTGRVLEACRQFGVERIVMASSSSVYGNTPTLPKHEEMVPQPLSPYALSKLAAEQLGLIFAEQYDLRVVALRYFNVFGPRQDPESQYAAVIPRFITRMLTGKPPIVYGDGMQSRDFTYIDNVVDANLQAAGIGALQGGSDAAGLVANVACGDRYTLLDLVAALNDVLGTSVEPVFEQPRPGDVRHSMAAIERAREAFGYRPGIGFRDGLARTVEWYRSRST